MINKTIRTEFVKILPLPIGSQRGIIPKIVLMENESQDKNRELISL